MLPSCKELIVIPDLNYFIPSLKVLTNFNVQNIHEKHELRFLNQSDTTFSLKDTHAFKLNTFMNTIRL